MGKIYKNGIEYGGGGGSAGHTILDTDGNSMPAEDNLQFKGLDVTDNSTDGVTEVESIGLNQDSLDDVTDGEIGNEIINNGMTYSTNEQIVGKWIDGKPLYQITIDCGEVPNSNDKTVYHNVANIENIVNIWGIAIGSSDSSPIPYYMTAASGIGCYVSKTFVALQTARNLSSLNALVTFQYTKTTDT